MISDTGSGLKIIINCEYKTHHNWMSFASWYSISKNLPDAEVFVECNRGLSKLQLFDWAFKCKVPFKQVSNKFEDNFIIEGNVLKIAPSIMAVSNYQGKLDLAIAKSNDEAVFVDYSSGCGGFSLLEWENKAKNPFDLINFLFSEEMLLNEYRILKLWKKCSSVYSVLI